LRHSWASQRLNEGVSLTVIGASMGHTNPTTTRRYAHLDRLKAIKAELGE
jgi:site-specific recombinase XerD